MRGYGRASFKAMAVMNAMCAILDARLDEVKLELYAVFQDQLDKMLVDISKKFDIPLKDLQDEYQVVTDTPTVPIVKVAKASKTSKTTNVSGSERPKCSAKTAKGQPCKNIAIFGGTMCACHSKTNKDSTKKNTIRSTKRKGVKPVSPPSSDDDSVSIKSPVRTRKPVVKKATQTHTHEIDDKVHTECSVCETLGNVASMSNTENVEVADNIKQVLDSLFNFEDSEDKVANAWMEAMNNMDEDDSDCESGSDLDVC